jgi:hypothetical protein
LRIRVLFLIAIFLGWGSVAYGDGQKKISEPGSGSTKSFLYVAMKYGIPILKASIKIVNGSFEQGRSLYQIQAHVDSLPYLGLLFRMNNRFTSTMELETCTPIRYVKEIDQEGLLVHKKHYLQTLTFDYPNKKVVVENGGKKEKQEIFVPPETYDPLSMFARCYLKEELRPDQEIRMSIYDGMKLHQMVFRSRKVRVRSKMFGEVEAICLESTTTFSTFGDQEGVIRIWYTAEGKKTPILMELDLPIGSVKFELEDMKES